MRKLKVNIFNLIILFSAFNKGYSQSINIDKVAIVNSKKSDSLFLNRSNEKCVKKFIENDSNLIKIYYQNAIVKNDSIKLNINNKKIFDKKVILENHHFPYLIGEIKQDSISNNYTFSLELYDYQIKSTFVIKVLENLNAILIKPIIDIKNINESYFIIILKDLDIHTQDKIKFCNRVYREEHPSQ